MRTARIFNNLSTIILVIGGCASLYIAVSAQNFSLRSAAGALPGLLEYPAELIGLLLMLFTVRFIITPRDGVFGVRTRKQLLVTSLLGLAVALALLESSLVFYVQTFYLVPTDPFSGLILVVVPILQLLVAGGFSGLLTLWKVFL